MSNFHNKKLPKQFYLYEQKLFIKALLDVKLLSYCESAKMYA